jgi:hypothetical protein
VLTETGKKRKIQNQKQKQNKNKNNTQGGRVAGRMFSSLFSKARNFFSNSQKILLAFFLNQNLRPYLKESIQQADLELQLSTGNVHLTNLVLNEYTLNGLLAGQGFRVRVGFMRDLSATIPWSTISTDSVEINIEGLSVTLTSFRPMAGASKFEPSQFGGESFMMSSFTAEPLLESFANGDNEETTESSPLFMISLIENMFRHIFSSLVVTLKDSTFYLRHKKTQLRVSFGYLRLDNPDAEVAGALTVVSRGRILFRNFTIEKELLPFGDCKKKKEERGEQRKEEAKVQVWGKVFEYTGDDTLEVSYQFEEEGEGGGLKNLQLDFNLSCNDNNECEVRISPDALESILELAQNFAVKPSPSSPPSSSVPPTTPPLASSSTFGIPTFGVRDELRESGGGVSSLDSSFLTNSSKSMYYSTTSDLNRSILLRYAPQNLALSSSANDWSSTENTITLDLSVNFGVRELKLSFLTDQQLFALSSSSSLAASFLGESESSLVCGISGLKTSLHQPRNAPLSLDLTLDALCFFGMPFFFHLIFYPLSFLRFFLLHF